MQTLIFAITFIILFNFLLYAPLYIRLRKARRQRLLQDARTEITKCATEFQQHLAKKDIVCGQFVHDKHYEAVNAAQFFEEYVVLKPVFAGQRQEINRTHQEIEREMKGLPPEIMALSQRFVRAYLRAAYYRHPVKFKVLVLRIVAPVIARKLRLTLSDGLLLRQRFKDIAMIVRKIHFGVCDIFVDILVPHRIKVAFWLVAIGMIAFGNTHRNEAHLVHTECVSSGHRL